MTDDSQHSRMRRIRLRKRLDELALVVVVVLLVLGGLGAWFAYQTHVEPGTETDERTVATWDEETSLTHAAEVREPNPVFEVGETLTNHPVYFTSLSPEFEGAYEYSYSASESGELDIEITASLAIRSVDGDGNAYWEVTEPLETVEAEGVAPGETTETGVTVNVTEAVAEADGIEAGVGSTIGTTEIELLFDAQAVGVVNDESVANTHQSSLSIDPDGTTYSVDADEGVLESHETVETFETERTYGFWRSYGPLVLLAGSLVGLVGFAGAKYRGRIPPVPAERAALERYQQRREFDDWISTGQVPVWGRKGTGIELDSLEDLVDAAIDMDQRVIEDRESGEFFVLDDGRYYTYAAESTLSKNGDGPGEDGELTVTADPSGSQTDSETASLFDDREETDATTDGGGAAPWSEDGAGRDRGIDEKNPEG